MNGSEAETIGELSRQIKDVRDDVKRLTERFEGSYVTQDIYHIAHEDLTRRVVILESQVSGRPSWIVATIIGALTTACAIMGTALISFSLR